MPSSNSALITKPLPKLKFTRQSAGECSSEYSSKQNFPGVHTPLANFRAYGARAESLRRSNL